MSRLPQLLTETTDNPTMREEMIAALERSTLVLENIIATIPALTSEYTYVKSVLDKAKSELDSLACCGNCLYYWRATWPGSQCPKIINVGNAQNPKKICYKWKNDGKTNKERSI